MQRRLERLGQTLADVIAYLEAVDDHLDGVLLVQLEIGRVVELIDLAIDPRTDIALGMQLGEQLVILALALGDHRGQQHQLAALRQRENLVDHLADRLRLERLAVGRTARRAGPREEQPQIVVDLSDRADRRTRVMAGGLLFDRDRRRQALDVVDVRLFHHRKELPGIGRQGFDVASLSLGIDGVEGQRGLAGTREAGNHDELVARQLEIDVLQVVGPGAPDVNRFHDDSCGG